MKTGKIEYQKSSWVKCRGRLFPKYEEQSWVVWYEEKKGIQFESFELANIYSELIKLKELLKELGLEDGK